MSVDSINSIPCTVTVNNSIKRETLFLLQTTLKQIENYYKEYFSTSGLSYSSFINNIIWYKGF